MNTIIQSLKKVLVVLPLTVCLLTANKEVEPLLCFLRANAAIFAAESVMLEPDDKLLQNYKNKFESIFALDFANSAVNTVDIVHCIECIFDFLKKYSTSSLWNTPISLDFYCRFTSPLLELCAKRYKESKTDDDKNKFLYTYLYIFLKANLKRFQVLNVLQEGILGNQMKWESGITHDLFARIYSLVFQFKEDVFFEKPYENVGEILEQFIKKIKHRGTKNEGAVGESFKNHHITSFINHITHFKDYIKLNPPCELLAYIKKIRERKAQHEEPIAMIEEQPHNIEEREEVLPKGPLYKQKSNVDDNLHEHVSSETFFPTLVRQGSVAAVTVTAFEGGLRGNKRLFRNNKRAKQWLEQNPLVLPVAASTAALVVASAAAYYIKG